MNTEHFIIIPDKVVHDVKNKSSYESSARPFPLKNTLQIRQNNYDTRIRPHCYTTAEMMQPPSDDVPTLKCCYLHACFIKCPGLIVVDFEKGN